MLRLFRCVNYSLPVNRSLTKLLLGLVLLVSVCTHAQVNKYSTLITGATYTPITGGATMNVADPALKITTIGFYFYFDGYWYDAVSISDTGAIYFMDFGIPVINPGFEGGDAITHYSNGAGAIAPFSCELTGTADREVRYVTTGTAPNRVFVVQWKNFKRQGAGNESIEFQARLYEGTNKIEFAYGNWTNPTVMTGSGPRGGQVGLRGRNQPSFKNMRVLSGGAWNAATSGVFSNALCHYDGDTPATKPSSTLRYIFSPWDLSVNIVPLGIGCAPNQLTVQVVNSGAAAYNFGAHPITVSATVYPVTQNLTTDLNSGILDPGEIRNVTFNAGFPAGLYYTLSAAISPVYDDYNTANNNTVLSQYVGHYPVPYTVTQPCTAQMSGTGTVSISGDVTPSVGSLGANDELRLNCKSSYNNGTSQYLIPTFDIQVSTNCGSSYTTMYANVAAPTVDDSSPHDVNMRFSLAAYAGQKIMVRLVPKVGVTSYDIWFNNIRFAPAAPLCVTNMLPISGATVQGANASLSWNASAGATSYDVYIGTTPTNLTLAGNTTQASYIANLAPVTQYYWRVAPRNASTFADDCTTINSFTTTLATKDLAVTEISVPTICPHVGNVIVTVKNAGTVAVDLSTQNATVTINKPAPTPQTLTGILNTGTMQPGETRQITIPGGNFTASGTYSVAATVSVAGDTFAGNDTATFAKTIDAYQPVPVNLGNISLTSTSSPARVYTTPVTGAISVGDHFAFSLSTKPSSSSYPFTGEMYIEINTLCDDDYLNYQYVASVPFVVGTNSSNWSATVPVDIDLSAYAGKYIKVRVIMPDNYYPDNGWLTEYHEARLMNTRFYITPKCATGTIPANGTVFLTDQTIYQSALLSWNAVPTANMYEVFLGTTPNPPSVGFTDLTSHAPGQLLPGTQYYWKVLPRNNDAAATSCEIQTFTTGYCTPKYNLGPQGDRQISGVQLGTLNNQTGASQSSPYHTFYTNVTVPNIAQGQNITLTVQMGSSANQYVGAWIDFNRNRIFEPSEGVNSTVPTVAYGGPVSLIFTVPANAVLGQTLMRVRNGINWQIPLSSSCGELTGSAYGETEDYYVNITPSTVYPQCAMLHSPANGATNVARTGNSVLLSWAAPTSGIPVASYDVYAGTTEANMVLKGNATTTSFNLANLSHGVQYYWKVVAKTSNGSAAVGCSVLSFTTKNPFAPYCSNIVYQYYTEPISRVTFAGINNASSNAILPSPNGYEIEDFTAITGNVTHGQTYALTIKANTSLSALSNFNVYIDWNQNGNFNDAGETYNAGYIEGSNGADAYGTTINISIPNTAVLGTTRMRVHKHFSPSPSPCNGSSTAGQMEDYTLNVSNCTPTNWYADSDNDGFGDPAVSTSSCSQPAGYVANNTDCSDSNPTAHQTFPFYADVDGDTYGVGSPVQVCSASATTPPTGYATNNTDCDGNNANAWRTVTLYQDADGDNYNLGSGSFCIGSSVPAGFRLTTLGIDCNDNDGSVWRVGSFYVDADNDNYSSGLESVCYGALVPSGFSTTSLGPDCDDNDSFAWRTVTLYQDADGDNYNLGYGSFCIGSSVPAGFSLTTLGIDCNDNDGSVWRVGSFYVDADNDSYSSGLESVCYGTSIPSGFSTTSLGPDCDDNDSFAWRTVTLYQDADGDNYNLGYGTFCIGSTVPAGFSLTTFGIDCDDNNGSVWQVGSFYVDADNDGYSAGLQGVCYGNNVPQGFNTFSDGPDCNDNDANTWRMETVYFDADNDNYDVGSQTMCIGLNPPQGSNLVSFGSDCDDNDGTAWQVGSFYVDADNDGYSAGLQSVCYGNNIPQGFNTFSDGPDCNDNDANLHQTSLFFVDADGDTFGTGSLVDVCTASGTIAPAGYSTNNLDCNDSLLLYTDADGDGFGNTTLVACDGVENNSDCDDTMVYYVDVDGDGYGNILGIFSACSGVTSHNDCNDYNPAITLPSTLYADFDHDGYGNSTVSIFGCEVPADYVSNNNDCDDTNATVHPGAIEIGYDLVDNDCDGLIDEGFAPIVSTILQCNSTLPTIDTFVYSTIVSGATGYRWRVTTMNGPTAGQVQFIDTPLRAFQITQLATYAFATTYKIEVGVYYAGHLQPYTTSNCTVSTPATGTELLNCGGFVLTNMTDVIYAQAVPFATGYRFKITDPVNPSNTQEIYRSLREFRMSLVTNFTVQYNKVYNVQVSIRNTEGSYIPYPQASCNVSTPFYPTVGLQESQCDAYVVPSNSTQIYATSHPGAIAYVFQIKGGTLPASGISITKQLRSFRLSDFGGQLAPNTPYNVRVRLIFSNADPEGPFGKTCSIVTPALAREASTKTKNVFAVTAYPNPFADNVNISITTASTEIVNLKIYDMTGRLLENLNSDVSEVNTLQIGDRYPSGVYNVIVSQGDEVKTLRIIKR